MGRAEIKVKFQQILKIGEAFGVRRLDAALAFAVNTVRLTSSRAGADEKLRQVVALQTLRAFQEPDSV